MKNYGKVVKQTLGFIYLIACFTTLNAQEIQVLHEGWQFREKGTKEWLAAKVPGVVHMDLLAANKIPDPFIGLNEKEVQWVEKKEWEYQLIFDVEDYSKKNNYELVFRGLDTYAQVFLNKKRILDADNMFRTWKIDVSDKLQKKENVLTVTFKPPTDVHRGRVQGLPYHRTAGNDAGDPKVSVYSRKAPFQFGWDWGPRLVTCGIWHPLELHAWKYAKLENVQLHQEDLEENEATIKAIINWQSKDKKDKLSLRIRDIQKNEIVARQDLSSAANIFELSFKIKNPILWQPRQLGDPHLYKYSVEILRKDEVVSQITKKIGLREVKLIREKDQSSILTASGASEKKEGESFYFEINGQALFLKGAGYIPQDPLLPRISKDDYNKLLNDVCAANMNTIRVWGGGIYESDYFYDLCDSLGILVWQDFMFSGGMYPGDRDFLRNVEQELKDNIRRLREHPSIIAWFGNNEVEVAWFNWGWQDALNLSKDDSLKMWNAYKTIFHYLIPTVLEEEDPDRPYLSTTPISNWGKMDNFYRGDMHYWGVWHGPDDFDGYEKYVGRFMSEYGFPSFPEPGTVKAFASGKDYALESPVISARQKSYIGNGKIVEFVNQYFKEVSDFDDLIYKSQLCQAIGLRKAVVAHRLNKGHCMGSLYWQLNDTWPAISWSTIDYYGKWKAAHYQLKELYNDLLVVPLLNEDQFTFWLVSDYPEALEGKLEIEVKSFRGSVEKQAAFAAKLAPQEKIELASVPLSYLLNNRELSKVYLKYRFISKDSVLNQGVKCLSSPKELELEKPRIKCNLDKEKKTLEINSDTFVKNLFIEAPGVQHFSINYFDLEPNQSIEINFIGKINSLDELNFFYLNP